MPIPPELLTMGVGAATGFLFKFMAERAKNREQQFKMLIQSRELSIQEADAASKRDGEGGKLVRRFIVISTLFGVILAPFILALFNYPIFMQITEEKKGFLWGLFGGGTQTKFVELGGYLVITEVRQTLTAIIGYYFGQSSVKTK
jgi:hypothetical protein|tara:strand:- start:310 stop:744 length:435 start_codon:yes stop_codon:yes gene_type:complete